MPSTISFSLSLLTSRNYSFLGLGAYLSHLNSSSHRSPRFSLRCLCSLVVRCALSRLRCNGHSLLLSSYFPRIDRFENSSCSACGLLIQDTSHLILYCPATDSLHRLLFVSTAFGPGPGELPGFWSSMITCHAALPRKGSCNNKEKMQSEASPAWL